MGIPLNGIAGTASKICHQVLNIPYPETEEEKLINSIKAAHSDWQRAEAMFHEVTEPSWSTMPSTIYLLQRPIYLLT
jgi:hypothetical protein